jgi:membrane associated rhomboid family serine protease
MLPLRDSVRSHKTPFICWAVILANVLVFLKQLATLDLELFISQYALIPENVDFFLPASLIPFLTSIFLHAGWVHLFSNMWFLKIFGDNIEATLGHIKFLLLYLFWGVVAGIVQYLFLTNSTIPILGASGAIAGVLGAYMVFLPHSKIEVLLPIYGLWTTALIPAPFMLLYWFITQLFSGTTSIVVGTAAVGGVAWWAHAGGFVAGYLTAKIFPKKQKKNQVLYPDEVWL